MREDAIHIILGQLVQIYGRKIVCLVHRNGLDKGQMDIIRILSEHGMLSQKELAVLLGVTPPTITVALQKLEKGHYIKRIPDQKDRRILRIEMDEKGKVLKGQVEALAKQIEEQLLMGMTMEERVLVRRLLLQMKENVERLNDGRGKEKL